MENKNVPSIRFKGFIDDWEQRNFFDSISSTIDFRGRTPKKLGMEWSESGYLALSALNVKSGYIDLSVDAHYGDEELYSKWMGEKILRKGQVIFTTEAPMGNVAQIPDDKGYILSQRTIAFEIKEDMMTNDFLTILLNSPLVSNHLSALSSGGTAKGVSQKSLRGLSVNVPSDIDEQQKIGLFFKRIDESIALQESELELLKLTKKGFLQQLFTNNSQLLPNIRFSDFQEEWEQHRLENVAKFSKGKGYTKNDLVQYGFKIILYGKMYTKYETIIESIDTYVKNNDDCIFSFKDDVIMPSSGESSLDIVRASVVPYAGIILGGDINIIELDKKIMNPIFIALSISNGTLKKEISNLAQGNSVVHLYNSELKKVNVQSPVIQEQEIIGNFFKQLDKIITLQENELENLKNLKSAFLQKIFI